jgi:hypothetical protein
MHLGMSDSVILVRSFAARLFISVISCGIHSPSDISTSLPVISFLFCKSAHVLVSHFTCAHTSSSKNASA